MEEDGGQFGLYNLVSNWRMHKWINKINGNDNYKILYLVTFLLLKLYFKELTNEEYHAINQSQSIFISTNFYIVRIAVLKPWSFTLDVTLSLSNILLCIYPSPKWKLYDIVKAKNWVSCPCSWIKYLLPDF